MLRIHTLPAIRLRTTQEIPTDRQPVAVRITLKGQRHQRPAKLPPSHTRNTGNPEETTKPLGIDLGIALSVATSGGTAYRSPRQEHLERQEVKGKKEAIPRNQRSRGHRQSGIQGRPGRLRQAGTLQKRTAHAPPGLDLRPSHQVIPQSQTAAVYNDRQAGLDVAGLPTPDVQYRTIIRRSPVSRKLTCW